MFERIPEGRFITNQEVNWHVRTVISNEIDPGISSQRVVHLIRNTLLELGLAFHLNDKELLVAQFRQLDMAAGRPVRGLYGSEYNVLVGTIEQRL